MTDLASAAARGGASTVLFQVVRMVIGIATMIVVARILSPSDFGLFAMILAIIGLAEVLRDFGFMNAAAQSKTLSDAQASNLFWINAGLGAVLGTVLFAAAPLIAAFYDEPRLADLTRALSLIFLLNGISVQFKAHLVRALKIFQVNVSETAAQLLGSVVVVTLSSSGLGYWSLFWQQLTVAVLALAFVAIFAGWLPRIPARAPMKQFVRYGSALAGQQSLNYVVRNVDTVSIGALLGASLLGFYDRAYQLLMIPIGQFNAPLTRVAVPTLARLWNSNGAFERYLHVAQKVAAFVTVPFFALMIGLGEVGVVVIYGERWALAGVVLQVLAVGGIFRSLMQITYWAYLSSGRTGTMLRFDLIALPLLAGTIVCGLPWGIIGVATAHSIGYAIYWFTGLWWMTRRIGLDFLPFVRTAARSLIVASIVAAAGLISAMVLPSPLTALIVGMLVSFACVLLLALLARPIKADYLTVLRVVKLAIGGKRGR